MSESLLTRFPLQRDRERRRVTRGEVGINSGTHMGTWPDPRLWRLRDVHGNGLSCQRNCPQLTIQLSTVRFEFILDHIHAR